MKHDIRQIILAAVLPLFILFILYLLKFLEVGMDWDFRKLGIYPMEQRGVFGIFAHPFVHSSWKHLLANTLPLFFLSWCLFLLLQADCFLYILRHLDWRRCPYVSARKARMAHRSQWNHLRPCIFSFFSGILRKHVPLIAISLLIAFLYGGLVWNMFPFLPRNDFLGRASLSGAIAGTLCALAFMGYGPQRTDPFADEEEEEEEERDGENGESYVS